MKPHHLLNPSNFSNHIQWMKNAGIQNLAGVRLAFDADYEVREITRNAYPHLVTATMSRLYGHVLSRSPRAESILDDICLAALEVSNETHA